MAHYARVQVELDRDNGLPEDSIINVYHFEADGSGGQSEFDSLTSGLVNRVKTFYNAIDVFLSSILAGTGRITVYDMSDDRPRVPTHVEPFTMVTNDQGALPSEIALCMSMHAAPATGQSQARRRGRVYLGPWGHSIYAVGETSGDHRPSATLRETILGAADGMATGVGGAFRLAVYSPTTIGPSPHAPTDDETNPAAWNDVVLLTIDDAWDTMRSRGAAPTSRVQTVIS
jgi:hypothetical protein